MSLSILQEQLGVSQSNFFKVLEIPIESNSIEFQTLQIPWVLIQILPQILKKNYKEICSLFDFLQIHTLFEIFEAW
jgi:hypothetical protein